MKWPWTKPQIAADPSHPAKKQRFSSLEDLGEERCTQIVTGLCEIMEKAYDCSGCVSPGFRLTAEEYRSILSPLGIEISYHTLMPLIYKAARVVIRVPFVVLHECFWSTHFAIVQNYSEPFTSRNPASNVECQGVATKTSLDCRVAEPTGGASVEWPQ